jgi:putative oxidoreductase
VLKQTAHIAAFGRLLIAVLFLLSGFGKFAAPSMTHGYIASVGLPAPFLGLVIAIAVELGGGNLLVLGYQTRIVALAMTVFTIATALAFHNNFSDQNTMVHILKNIAITGGLLQIVAFGAGSFSIDRRRSSATPRSVPVA